MTSGVNVIETDVDTKHLGVKNMKIIIIVVIYIVHHYNHVTQ